VLESQKEQAIECEVLIRG